MTTEQIVVLVVVVLLVAAVAAALLAASRKKRSEQLRGTFGSEYDRTLEQAESRKAAERELAARQERHAQLEIRPLSASSRQRYVEAWGHVQSRFVDEPVLALTEADALVTRLMAERGFPTDGPDEQAAMLSVQHRHVLDSFRAGHAIEERNSTRSADTEQVRQGMLHFRTVFEGLVEDAADGAVPAGDGAATARDDDRAWRGERRDDAQPDRDDDRRGPDPVRVERNDRDADLAQSRLHDGRPAVVVRDSAAPGAAAPSAPAAPSAGSAGGSTAGPLRPIVPPGAGDAAPREGDDPSR